MIKVWVLILTMNSASSYPSSIAIIDNIASREDCLRAASSFEKVQSPFTLRVARCVEIWKVK